MATEFAKKQASFCQHSLFQCFQSMNSKVHSSLGSCCRLVSTAFAKRQTSLCQDLLRCCQYIKSRAHSSLGSRCKFMSTELAKKQASFCQDLSFQRIRAGHTIAVLPPVITVLTTPLKCEALHNCWHVVSELRFVQHLLHNR